MIAYSDYLREAVSAARIAGQYQKSRFASTLDIEMKGEKDLVTEVSEMFAGREAMIAAMQTRLIQVAAAENLPLMLRTRTYNSRRAQELGKWAESQGIGDQFHQAVYRAYFVDGINIALIDELALIAESIGLSPVEARKVIETGSFAAAVDADWQLSRELRVTAVPTHIYAGKRLAGFAAYEDFERLIGKR